MTAQDVITRARYFVKDDIVPYRISDAAFFPQISDALVEMKARRPDFLIKADGTFASIADITSVEDTINFPDRTREAIACYTAYRNYITDDADRHNTSQAAAMLNRYESLMMTV